MAIAPDSSSYPILGAARACGVDYDVALGLVDWERQSLVAGGGAQAAGCRWMHEGTRRHGRAAMIALFDMLLDAFVDGRIYMPGWAR